VIENTLEVFITIKLCFTYMVYIYFLEFFSDKLLDRNLIQFDIRFVFSVRFLRPYVSPEDKLRYSNALPSWFDEVMCGLILKDGNIRLNGRDALLSIQQTPAPLGGR
jgi:hypothetical protein